MAFIDDKGRLLGKINIIDLMVIMFVVLIIAVGAKFVLFKPAPEYITAEVLAQNQPYEVISRIAIGSQILDSSQIKVGEVLEIDTIPAGANKDLTLYLNLSVRKEDGRIYFLNNEMLINRNLDIKIANIKLDTRIISLNQTQTNEKKAAIEVLFKNREPWLAEIISKGDIEVSHKGRIVARIKDAEYAPAQMVITSDTGNVYEREHPLNKDITAKFEIIAKKKGNSLLFHNQEVKIGQQFTFYNENYIITGTIISRE
ncbi:MAG: DUF4330 domain-containing protein [Nanoarchaeota archaeon]|nr:DUF4330 domain-containing protein [Nanoarchaeota archaeon]